MWEKVSALLTSRKISIYKLCKDNNIPLTTGYRWQEHGKISKAEHLITVAKYLKVSVESLM